MRSCVWEARGGSGCVAARLRARRRGVFGLASFITFEGVTVALRLPIEFTAEYRGQQPAGEFVRKDTGEVVSFPPKLKFEYETDDGDVTIVPIGATQLDKCEPAFDHAALKKGQVLRLSGFAILQDRGSDRDSYFAIQSVAYADNEVKPLKVATGS